MSKYSLGLIAGRFQPFHNGHLYMLKRALEVCETVLVLIGSCNNINSEYNPLTYDERVAAITCVLKNNGISESRVLFAPLVDICVGNHPAFGHYIMNTCKFITGTYPDVLISGTEPDRDLWIDKKVYPDLDYLHISRSDIKVSATMIRTSMCANTIDWESMVPDCLIGFYIDKVKSRLK